MTRPPLPRIALLLYATLVVAAAGLAAVRLTRSLDMPGLGAFELVLLALPWSLLLGAEPLSRLGWAGMVSVVVGGLGINAALLWRIFTWVAHRSAGPDR